MSHKGILEDQGRDPEAFFGGHGVEREQCSTKRWRSRHPLTLRDPAKDGPHVVTGPIRVRARSPATW